MDKFFNEEDYRLLDKDIFTFQVLQRIMPGNCKLKLTDHKNFISSSISSTVQIQTGNGGVE